VGFDWHGGEQRGIGGSGCGLSAEAGVVVAAASAVSVASRTRVVRVMFVLLD